MEWYQIVVIVLITLNVTINLIFHGEERGVYNVFTAVLGAMIHFTLLYFGGFWT